MMSALLDAASAKRRRRRTRDDEENGPHPPPPPPPTPRGVRCGRGGISSKLTLVLLLLGLLQLAATTQSATRIHTIHWNSSNPLFRIDRNDNVIDINGGNHPWEYDQVNIVCPVYKPGTDTVQQEQYIIYSVTRQEYESCRITQTNPKIVALCNRPHELMYFTITFRSFTPTPGALEFRPGQDYYFISTSSRNDLHRRVGGGCSSNNMKVVFRVAPDEHQLEEQDNDIDVESNENSGDRPLPRNPKLQFPWSRQRDFRRTFSYYNYDANSQHGGSASSAAVSGEATVQASSGSVASPVHSAAASAASSATSSLSRQQRTFASAMATLLALLMCSWQRCRP